MTRVPALDGVRGIAIALVVLAHLRLPLSNAAGAVGVVVFFALSGYLITGLALSEHARSGQIDLPAFWGRRARRLLPALAVFLAMMWVVELARGGEPFGAKAAAAMFYYANRFAVGHNLSPIQHTWSLSVEEQFYLLWPPVLFLLLRIGRPRTVAVVALLLAVASCAWRCSQWRDSDGGAHAATVISRGMFTSVFAMLAGCAVASAETAGLRMRAPSWLGGAAVAGLLVVSVGRSLDPSGFVQAAVFAVPLALALLVSRSPFLTARPLVLLGRVSYGLYLWHGGVLFVMEAMRVQQPTRALVGLPLTAMMTWVSWRFIEQPAMRWSLRPAPLVGLGVCS